jgi:energy-coupling factor transporter ATP-binding protein EcfA2
MQIAELSVTGLFGQYDHIIPMPGSSEESSSPSVVILHGPNGVGKTTVLQMLNGVMQLDFDTFRQVPFKRFQVDFSSGDTISTERLNNGELSVTFKGRSVRLSATKKGAAEESEQALVESFRSDWSEFISAISFEFLDESRVMRRTLWLPNVLEGLAPHLDVELLRALPHQFGVVGVHRETRSKVQSATKEASPLGEKVRRFTQEAQVDYRPFFLTREPDLFSKILENLSSPGSSLEGPDILERKLLTIRQRESTHLRLGLGQDRLDYDQLLTAIQRLKSAPNDNALVVLNTYIEFLESRSDARQLISDRLETFEQVMDEFFEDKEVRVNRAKGIEVKGSQGDLLEERQLSSGEYQLLYLMVSALTTRRIGTVIAIDEPELSIHIEWQRKLVHNFLRCASRATPQLILATHSPDISGDYLDRMVMLKPNSGRLF